MKNLILGVYLEDEDGNVISKRPVGKNWSVDNHDMKGFHNKLFFEEVSAILTENLKISLTENTIMEMFEEIMKGK